MNRYVQYMYSYPHKTAYRPLQNVSLIDYMENLAGEGHSLYLHLPFCESKCGYCNLFSVAGCGRDCIDAYLDALVRQLEQYREILPKSTVFENFTIGGGTPLLLDPGQLQRTLQTVRAYMPLRKDCDIIIETAPKQTDGKKARMLKELGVTRVSMGIQSFQEEELAWLGRQHDGRRAQAAAELLTGMGFGCVNFDFIYGLPGQTPESLLRSLEKAVSYLPDELFLYPLYIKHGVRLEKDGKGAELDSDHTYRLYRQGAAYLKGQGYVQISMRRFVKRKNVHGTGREFQECGFTGALSLGCGGRSYLGRLHACTPYRTARQGALEEIQEFCRREEFLSVTNGILLSDEEIKRRYVIKHLLIGPGISRAAYGRSFGAEVTEDFPIFRTWTQLGWLEEIGEECLDCGIRGENSSVREGDRDRQGYNEQDWGSRVSMDGGVEHSGGKKGGYIGLTEEGLGLSDYLGPQLISEEVRKRMLEWERDNGQENSFL